MLELHQRGGGDNLGHAHIGVGLEDVIDTERRLLLHNRECLQCHLEQIDLELVQRMRCAVNVDLSVPNREWIGC